MKKILLALGILVCIFLNAQCLKPDHLDLVKIADKVRSVCTSGYWKEWASTPFSILLVEDEHEYVLNTRTADTSFFFGCDSIQFRQATMNKHFLATFPMINRQPTIVVGTPENTRKSPEGWIVTLLHEHFHQLQFTHPEYYTAQKKLGLDKGDQTGMWMLNHPFPYDRKEVVEVIRKMSTNLLNVYAEKPGHGQILVHHKRLKAKLQQLAGQEHYTYFNLQLWQEGFSRFMEILLLEDWIDNFDQVDQQAFSRCQLLDLLTSYHKRIKKDLSSGDLADMKREYFYSLGAAEAMLIARTNPDWKVNYFEKLYDTDHLLVSQ